MAYPIGFAGPVTQVDSTPVTSQLGLTRREYDPTYGWREWVYVRNDDASALAIGQVVGHEDTTVSPGVVVRAPVSSPAARVVGVAQHAIASGSASWVLTRGVGLVLAGNGTIDTNESIVVDTVTLGTAMEAGALGAAVKFDVEIGWAFADAAATATALCFVKVP